MKKFLSILLILCLTVPFASFAEKNTEEMMFQIPDETAASVFSDGEAFYIEAGGTFCRWVPNEKKPVFLMQGEKKAADDPVYFFFYHGKFHEINLKEEAVYRLQNHGEMVHREKIFSLNQEIFLEEADWENEETVFKGVVALQTAGDYLCAILKGSEKSELYTLNLKSGESSLTPFRGQFLVPYKDGKLLCVMPEKEEDAPNPFKSYYFAALNPENGNTEKTADGLKEIRFRDIYGIHFDEKSDVLYILKQYQIYMLPKMKNPVLCAEISGAENRMNSWQCIGSTALLQSGENLVMKKLDPEYKELPPVVLSNEPFDKEAYQRSLTRAGGMKVKVFENSMSWDEISAAIISRSDLVDIYIVSSGYTDMKKVMEKGYCVSLNESEKLSSFGNALYPYLQKGCVMNDNLYAVPVYQHALCTQVMEDWSQIEDIPKIETLEELCDVVNRWESDGYLEKYSDYVPSLMERSGLMWTAYELYLDYLMTTHQHMTLDTPLFRKIMEIADSVGDTSGWLDVINNEEELMYGKTHFVFENEFCLSDQMNLHRRNVPLKLMKDTIPSVGFYVNYAFVNPYSKNTERAIKYLEYYTESLDDIKLAEMCPGWEKPIEDPKFADQAAYMDWELEMLTKGLGKAESDEEKQEYQKKLDAKKAEKEEYVLKNQYIVTAEDLEFYRSLDQGFFLRTVNPVDNEDVRNIFYRYMDGQISLEQFIREADNKIQLIVLENQ